MKHLTKKLFSMLMVVLMLVGMLPMNLITATAAEAYDGTGTFTQCTGTLSSGYYVFGVGTSEESISALNTTATSNWIKFTTTTSASGTITDPDSSIVWYYDAGAGTFNNGTNYVTWPTTGNSAGLNTTGTPVTVTETSTAGVYNITVTATPARVLRLNGTSGYRFYTSSTGTDTFYFFKLKESTSGGETTCEHINTVAIGEAKDATCTEDGITAGKKCSDCGTVITAQETIPATGHTYVNGVCSVCDDEAKYYDLVTSTNSFAVGDQVMIACTSKNVAMGAQSGTYRGIVEVTITDNQIIAIAGIEILTIEEGSETGKYALKTSDGQYLYWDSENSLETGSTSYDWTISVDDDGIAAIASATTTDRAMKYNSNNPRFACYTSGQSSVSLYKYNAAATGCQHTNTTTVTVDATCVTAGSSTVTCDKCGYIVSTTPIAALNQHEFDDGVCTRCSAANVADNSYILWMADGNAFTTLAEDKYYGDPALTLLTLVDSEPSGYTDDVKFTVTAQNGTWTIVDRYGKYIYAHSGSYMNFNASKDTQTFGAGWLFIAVEGGYNIYNVDRNLYIGVNGTVFCLSETPAVFKLSVVEAPCKHTNTEAIGEAKDATCTETGMTAGKKCSDCGYVIEEQETISMIAHDYVDGCCSVCNAVKPVYLLTDLVDIGPKDKVIITVTNAENVTYALPNEITSSKPSAVTVTVNDNTLENGTDSLEWNIVQDNGSLTIYVDESETNTLYWASSTNVGVGVSTNNSFEINEGYLYYAADSRRIGVYSGKDWRAYQASNYSSIANQTLAFYVYTIPCAHENEEERPEVPATCTEAGREKGTFCLDCEKYITGGTVIDALGHTYGDDGYCTYNCGTRYPIANNQKYYIATIRSSGNYWYMTNAYDGDNDRLVAEDSTLTALPEAIDAPAMNKVFVAIKNEDGTWSIKANGIATAERYLGWSSGNTVKLVALADAIKFTAVVSENGIVNLKFTVSETEERYLSLNGANGSDYFACYKGTQKQDLVLIPVNCTEHTAVEIPALGAACETNGHQEGTWCSVCGEIITEPTVLEATGHQDEASVVDPTYTDKGYTLNTCTVCGRTQKTDWVDVLENPVAGRQVILQDNIGMSFTLVEGAEVTDVKVAGVSVGYETTDAGILVYVAAAQMCDSIDIYVNEMHVTNTYSVKEYADAILTDTQYEYAWELVQYMLVYGGASQTYFGYNTANLASSFNEDIALTPAEIEGKTMEIDGSVSGIKFYGVSLLHKDKIGMRFYFTGDITGMVAVADKDFVIGSTNDGKTYVEVNGINPQELGEQIEVTITPTEGGDGLAVLCSPLNYICRMYNKANASEELKNLVQALYGYYLAASEYVTPSAQ